MENITLQINDIGMNMEGVAKNDGKVYFVKNALVDETVTARIVDDKKKYACAELEEIVVASKDRVEPLCPYFYDCGGCNAQHILYEKQLYYKKCLVENTLKKVANIDFTVLDAIASDMPFFYRNKGVFPVVQGLNSTSENPSGFRIGMFKNNTHDLLEISQCFLMNDNITKVYNIVKDFFAEHKVIGYDFSSHTGDIKFLVVRSCQEQTLVCLVATKSQDWFQDLFEVLNKSIDNVGLYVSYNTQKNPTILGVDFEYIGGIKKIILNEFNIQYTLDVSSFLQVNTDIKNKIYGKIVDEIKDFTVIDAYAGAGLLSAIMSKNAKYVYSIEINKQATQSAKRLVSYNKINNMEAINGDCSKVLPAIAHNLTGKTAIILDPPRVGCSEKVIKSITNADVIMYISCNPISLAQDLQYLTQFYNIDYMQPYDMFPQTKHIETLVRLSKK